MLFGAGGKKPPLGKQHAELNSVRIQSSAYGKAIPIVYGTNRLAGNLLWYGDFQAITTTDSTRAGGKGGGSVTTTQQKTNYYAALAFALCEGTIAGIGNIYKGKEIHTLSDLGLTLFTGTTPTQTPWGYLTTNHPGQDLGYEGLAYVAVSSLLLDQSGNLPNFNYEVQGLLRYNSGATGQLADAEPSSMLYDLLTNLQYGAGLSASQIGSLTAYQQYCVANGFFLSPVLDSQQQAVDVLKQWLEITNTGAIWSEGIIKTIPYGDSAITGNGMTFTPNLTPIYTLTDDDYIYSEGDDPIDVQRSTPADAFNIIKVEFSNRSNNYANEIAEAKDQNAINSHGPRPSSTFNYHEITSPTVARQVGQILLQRQLYKRNTYKFKVGWKYILLEPMDVIGLTDSTLGISNYLVRITDVEESENGELTITAEDMLLGTGAAALYGSQTGSGYQTNYNVAPGNVNTPLIFEAPFLITAPRDGAEVWVVASGGSNWGGCEVWVSTDNSTFQKIGTIMGTGRQGVLSATFASGTDPDTTNTCSVDLTQSRGALLSATNADADAADTLCYVDGELVAYSTATLTTQYKYNLTTYTRRGLYGTAIGSHAINSVFARLDQATVKLYVPQDKIGTTFYFKFLSFNIYGAQLQSLASVSAYSFTTVGKNPPPTVTGFSVQQRGQSVFFGWTEVNDPGLKGYDIRYQPQGTVNWSTATPLVQAQRGTEVTTASVLPGAYTFLIRARDILDQLSTTITSANLTVINSMQTQIYSSSGTYTFTVPANVDTLDIEVIAAGGGAGFGSSNGGGSSFGQTNPPLAPSLSQAVSGALAATTYYVKTTWVTPQGETSAGTEGSLAVSANNVLVVGVSGSPPPNVIGWNVYVSTATGTEKKQNASTLSIGSSWTEPTSGITGTGAAAPTSNTTGLVAGGGKTGSLPNGGTVLVAPSGSISSNGNPGGNADGANLISGSGGPGPYGGGGFGGNSTYGNGSLGGGAGAAGAGSFPGAGAGSYIRYVMPVKPGDTYTVVVGAGGTAATDGSGGSGGTGAVVVQW